MTTAKRRISYVLTGFAVLAIGLVVRSVWPLVTRPARWLRAGMDAAHSVPPLVEEDPQSESQELSAEDEAELYALRQRVREDTVFSVAELAAKQFADEEERRKSIESKAGVLLATTSAVIGLVFGNLTKPPESLALVAAATSNQHWAALTYSLLSLLSLGALAIAGTYFVRTIWVHEYDRPELDHYVRYSVLGQERRHVLTELAASYSRAIYLNAVRNTTKVKRLRRGAWSLALGMVALAAIVMLILYMSVYRPPERTDRSAQINGQTSPTPATAAARPGPTETRPPGKD